MPPLVALLDGGGLDDVAALLDDAELDEAVVARVLVVGAVLQSIAALAILAYREEVGDADLAVHAGIVFLAWVRTPAPFLPPLLLCPADADRDSPAATRWPRPPMNRRTRSRGCSPGRPSRRHTSSWPFIQHARSRRFATSRLTFWGNPAARACSTARSSCIRSSSLW